MLECLTTFVENSCALCVCASSQFAGGFIVGAGTAGVACFVVGYMLGAGTLDIPGIHPAY